MPNIFPCLADAMRKTQHWCRFKTYLWRGPVLSICCSAVFCTQGVSPETRVYC